MERISIIVPVHNTPEECLLECFESIKNQTYKNRETIIVDDGSNKDVARFLDRYIKGLDNWRVIHQKNAGVNMARKTGFEQSEGDFVTFVDSDDSLMEVFCEHLYKAAIKTGADATIAERCEFETSRPINLPAKAEKADTLTDKHEIVKANYVAPFGMNIYSVTIWGQLYKRSLLEKIDWEFSNYTIAEDEFWAVQTKILSDKITYVHEQLYCYRISQSSRSKMTKEIYFKGYGENRAIPFISLGLEIFHQSKQLYEKHNIVPPEELLVYAMNCTKAFVYRVFKAHELDAANNKLAQDVATELLSFKARESNKEPFFEIELIKASPEAFVQYMRVIEENREEIARLQGEISARDRELQLLRTPGVRGATKKLLGSLKRHVR